MSSSFLSEFPAFSKFPVFRQFWSFTKFSVGVFKRFHVGLGLFIHSSHIYSAHSSPLLLRGAPDCSTDTVSEFHAEAHRQLQVQDLPKVLTWRLEQESNPRPPVESHRLNQGATTSHNDRDVRQLPITPFIFSPFSLSRTPVMYSKSYSNSKSML